jgi:hypothetical protein
MRKLDLGVIFERGMERRSIIDFLFLVFLLGMCLWIFGGNRRLFGLFLFVIVFIFIFNEVSVSQSLGIGPYDSDRMEYTLVNTTTPLQLPSMARLALHLPLIICGGIQYINYIRGDKSYRLTKEFGTSLITQAPKRMVYRALSGPLPNKMIYLIQHVGAVLDNATFLQFIPEGYNLRVLNKADANPLGLFPKSSRKNLFGAHFIDPRKPESLKESLTEFVRFMVEDTAPTVYCIWPSGKLWNSKLENGTGEFKPGAFYMSCFTGIPVCFVHTRFKGMIDSMLMEQTPLMYPPDVDHGENSYVSFYENPGYKDLVLGFRDHVEGVYRQMDTRMAVELTSRGLEVEGFARRG